MPGVSKSAPRVVIFAGPNGADKSKQADALLATLNLLYLPLADEWTVFDNSTAPNARPVAAKIQGQLTVTEPTT